MPLVTFLPERKTVSVPVGTPLIETGKEAGLEIVAPCGTRGNCGKCVVQVLSGSVKLEKPSVLSESAIHAGYVQACQALVQESDLTIDVPIQHITSGQFADNSRDLDKIDPDLLPKPADLTALTVSCHMTLSAVDSDSGLTDAERLTRLIQDRWGNRNVTFTLDALRKLPTALRNDTGAVTLRLSQLPESNQVIDILPGNCAGQQYGIAIDIGTTTVSVQLVSLIQGETVDTKTDYNGQIVCGLDIISRINYAAQPEKLSRLTSLVLKTINHLIETIAAENGLHPTEIANVAISGNTTMTHLLLGLSPEQIRLAPYTPTILELPIFKAAEIGIGVYPDASVHIAPAVGSYIGGDITAGLLCTSISAVDDEVVMFIDIGTNGEMAIGNNQFILACACSAGPAFEGGGIRHGMRAAKGAIESVSISSETGTATLKTIGDASPRGICGSGIISLLAGLFRTGWIDPDGKLNRNRTSPAIRIENRQAHYVLCESSEKGDPLCISEAEIENVIRAKAAIYSAISLLLLQAEIDRDEISKVYIAGGFGHFLNLEDAITIGLLPDIDRERYQYVGNASLMGSTMALISQEYQKRQLELGRRITYIELSMDASYLDQYTAALFLPHTDRHTFPSVKANHPLR